MNLRILNEVEPNVLPYLPYGVTTLEMKIGRYEDEPYGDIYPYNRPDSEKKSHVGFADGSEDFLVLWGGGKEKGLNINKENVNGRLFLQILHKGKNIDQQCITLCHSKTGKPICVIKLVPAEVSPNLVTMKLNRIVGTNSQTITFKGNRMPNYYSRWFPPRAPEKKIQYHHVKVPQISIKFRVKEEYSIVNVDSNIDIFLDDLKIGQVTGDWCYSGIHAEIFTIFGDSDFLVLRLWMYWINTDFSRKCFGGENELVSNTGDVLTNKSIKNEVAKRGLWESFDIECPDNERFDFLIDMRKKKVTWLGTDFHYQESWYRFEETEPFVKARIANDFNTLEQVFQKLGDRFNQPRENYDPMIRLKEILRKPDAIKTLTQQDVQEIQAHKVTRGVGFTRKHVPYAENGNAVAELVSSVVTS